jgi:hypothetical protein
MERLSVTSLVDADLSLAEEADFNTSQTLYGTQIDLSICNEIPNQKISIMETLKQTQTVFMDDSAGVSSVVRESDQPDTARVLNFSTLDIDESNNATDNADVEEKRIETTTYSSHLTTEAHGKMDTEKVVSSSYSETVEEYRFTSEQTLDEASMIDALVEERLSMRRSHSESVEVVQTSSYQVMDGGHKSEQEESAGPLASTRSEKYTIIRSLKPNLREVVRAFPDDGRTNYAAGVRLGWTTEVEGEGLLNHEHADEFESQVQASLCALDSIVARACFCMLGATKGIFLSTTRAYFTLYMHGPPVTVSEGACLDACEHVFLGILCMQLHYILTL